MPREIEHELEFVEVLARIPDGLYERKARDAEARLTAPPAPRHMLARGKKLCAFRDTFHLGVVIPVGHVHGSRLVVHFHGVVHSAE